MSNQISVGLGDLKFSSTPEDVLVAYGLGSCVGVSVYDPKRGRAGLLHAVLPENKNGVPDSSKFVDSGILVLLREFQKYGAAPDDLIVKLVGGANMLVSSGLSFEIGERNTVAAKNMLGKLNLKISAEVVGGHVGRTMRVYVADGRVTVRSLGQPEEDI